MKAKNPASSAMVDTVRTLNECSFFFCGQTELNCGEMRWIQMLHFAALQLRDPFRF
jgi:hypothetical protein